MVLGGEVERLLGGVLGQLTLLLIQFVPGSGISVLGLCFILLLLALQCFFCNALLRLKALERALARMQIGFLVDRLTALMMVVVTFVSLMVHIYTVG